MGKPVVATRVGVVPEVLEDGLPGCSCPRKSPARSPRRSSGCSRTRASARGSASGERARPRAPVGRPGGARPRRALRAASVGGRRRDAVKISVLCFDLADNAAGRAFSSRGCSNPWVRWRSSGPVTVRASGRRSRMRASRAARCRAESSPASPRACRRSRGRPTGICSMRASRASAVPGSAFCARPGATAAAARRRRLGGRLLPARRPLGDGRPEPQPRQSAGPAVDVADGAALRVGRRDHGGLAVPSSALRRRAHPARPRHGSVEPRAADPRRRGVGSAWTRSGS